VFEKVIKRITEYTSPRNEKKLAIEMGANDAVNEFDVEKYTRLKRMLEDGNVNDVEKAYAIGYCNTMKNYSNVNNYNMIDWDDI
jgi:hypothetical protein